jgi:hypothetical protein
MTRYILRPTDDPLWSEKDYARAATLEARWAACGIAETDRQRLIPCAVWSAKFPGTLYDSETMKELESLVCKT